VWFLSSDISRNKRSWLLHQAATAATAATCKRFPRFDSFAVKESGERRAIGKWRWSRDVFYKGRPRLMYHRVGDGPTDMFIMLGNGLGGIFWTMFSEATPRPIYKVSPQYFVYNGISVPNKTSFSIPKDGWQVCRDCTGDAPLPNIQIDESSERKGTYVQCYLDCEQYFDGRRLAECDSECKDNCETTPTVGRSLF